MYDYPDNRHTHIVVAYHVYGDKAGTSETTFHSSYESADSYARNKSRLVGADVFVSRIDSVLYAPRY